MDEFKPKQTNPYSVPAEPAKPFSPPVSNTPAPEPAPISSTPANEDHFSLLTPTELEPQAMTPVAEPAPLISAPMPSTPTQPEPAPSPQAMIEQTPAEPAFFDSQPQTQPAQPKPAKKPIPKALIIVPVILLVISAIAGGWLLYSRQVGSLQQQLSKSEEEIARLSSSFPNSGGQGLNLIGGEQGEVAGENTESDIIEDFVYNAQVVIRDNQLLLESYVDVTSTGEIESIWINYGGGKNSLQQQTEKTTEGFAEKKEGVVQAIAYADVNNFEAGSSYMYRTSVKGKNGKIYKSGYSVFTIPGTPDSNAQDTPEPSQSGL